MIINARGKHAVMKHVIVDVKCEDDLFEQIGRLIGVT